MAGFRGRKGVVRACLVASTMLVAPHLGGAQAQPAGATQRSFDIPAQPLGAALTAFARQTGIQFAYPASLTSGRTSPALRGSFSPEDALARLLAGSGLVYAFTGPTRVTISAPVSGGSADNAGDGAIALDAIDVSGARAAADQPFETPGSTNYISSEEIERFPPQTAGALFQGTPGVISGGGNNGASIDPNIRGLQGQNRVATTIDGSQQSTSSYRGYAGVDSRAYVDPDMISGITITKGPDGAVAGAIGGTIAIETLNVEDILKAGERWGVRVRGGLATNSVDPVVGETAAVFGGGDGAELTNGSFALAVREDNVDVIGAVVRRKTGNYFAGTQGSLTTTNYLGEEIPLSNYDHGQLVYNTSEDVTSALLKATFRPTDEQELQIGYLYYGNEFGEISPSAINAGTNVTFQIPLSSVAINQVTARYHYDPSDNDLVDFKLNAYLSNTDETNVFAVLGTTPEMQQQSKNVGVNASNTSHFMVRDTPLDVTFGGSFTYEDAEPVSVNTWADVTWWAIPADGDRTIGSLFARVNWEPTSWLALAAGIEYLTYETNFNGTTYYATDEPFAGYSGDGFSPSASITVTPLEGWQIYGQYQSGIRPPSVRETSQTRADQVFTTDLEAEQASNWEVGTNFLRDNLFMEGDKARLKLAYFDNTTNNYIGRTFTGAMSLFNYDYVRFKGFEISGRYDAGPLFTEFGFNYYTDYEACLDDGTCLDYTLPADYLTNQVPPQFTASFTAGARLFDDRMTIGGRVTYMGERLAPVVDDGSYFVVTKLWEPYTTVDAFVQWKLNENLTLDVSALNILDAYYVDALNNTDMPAPGRTITATLTGRFGSGEPLAPLPLGLRLNNEPWTGLYAGASFGYGFASIDGTTTLADGTANAIAATESANETLDAMLGGGQIGYNYQFRNGIVLGVEADFSWLAHKTTHEALATEAQILIDNEMWQAKTDYSFDWLSTIRAKAGYAFSDRLFVYGTGGVAFLRESEQRSQYIATTSGASVPNGHTTTLYFTEAAGATRTGFAVGGGAEYALSDRWSLKMDYLFTGFGSESFLFPNARAGVGKSYTVTTRCLRNNSRPPCPGGRNVVITQNFTGSSETVNGREASNDANLQMLKIGLNYRF